LQYKPVPFLRSFDRFCVLAIITTTTHTHKALPHPLLKRIPHTNPRRNSNIMGAVVSCIEGVFHAIGKFSLRGIAA
jgi:hypothetical protein